MCLPHHSKSVEVLQTWAILHFFISIPVHQMMFSTLAFSLQPKLIFSVLRFSTELVRRAPFVQPALDWHLPKGFQISHHSGLDFWLVPREGGCSCQPRTLLENLPGEVFALLRIFTNGFFYTPVWISNFPQLGCLCQMGSFPSFGKMASDKIRVQINC